LSEVDFEIDITSCSNVLKIEDKVARRLNEITRMKKIPSQVLIVLG
jgi:hypothetical protein